ncbi:hypothetical protein BDP27DRAFT_1232520 [Rhodocollybia butyracea]|uniref:Uncharacterized protein n=1 Tax=Rhodocollybia butyracea TaxID=206335 RepID=A0A9P5PJJ3_9AGAR|nr:hypothetical protein BDP27DRAFT_1232520 [Rhodocollybia butyracea]
MTDICSICCQATQSILQIFWSCASTLIACTWVSIHPNIPGPKDKWRNVLGEKILLMLVALIAPELIMFWAIRDWQAARTLARRFETKGWTKSHAFFALMGGFALYEGKNTTYNNNSELDDRSLLAHADFIGQMTESEIKDRSHSDGFSKLVAVTQTTWLVIQLLARVAQGLPTTELEIMTTAFVFMNVLFYFFWWNKPQGVGCPIRIQRTRKSLSASPDFNSAPIREGDGGDDPTPHLLSAHQTPKQRTFSSFTLSATRTVHEIWKSVCNCFLGAFEFWEFDVAHAFKSSSMIEKFVLVVWYSMVYPFMFFIWLWALSVGSGLGYDAEKIRSFEDHLGIEMKRRSVFISCGTTTTFGAIHCTAWGLAFSSAKEQLLWRISSLVVVGAPLATLICYCFEEYTSMTDSGLVYAADVFCTLLGSVSYPLARFTLIVLAFMALKNLPYGALETVQWTALIPHI